MTTIESVWWFSLQACAFRGHDESSSFSTRGSFMKMIRLIGRMSVNIDDIVLEKALKIQNIPYRLLKKKFCIFSWTKWGKKSVKKLEMKSFVFWLMKWKMHQIKNKWLLFWDLLIFRVFYERVLFLLCMFQILLLQH